MYGMFAIQGKGCGSYGSSLECSELEQFNSLAVAGDALLKARRSRFSWERGARQPPADIDEVVGNDSQTHPALHARIAFIEAAAQSVASLEHADAPFAADAPALRFAEPALRTLCARKGNRDPRDS
jgi:hypothetical protein